MTDNLLNENIVNEMMVETPVEMPPQRLNPFCVISKDSVKVKDVNGKMHDLYMIETNSSWSSNPYGESYAVVPDEMVQDIIATGGYLNIKLSEDGAEVVSFEPLEKPVIPTPEPEPTAEQKRIAELENEIAMLTECCADILYTSSLAEMQAVESEVTE